VSQISPPIRIVIVIAVAVLAAWMLFLRPQEAVVPPAPAGNLSEGQPAQSAPGKVAEAAKKAAGATDARSAIVDGEGEGATANGTKPGAKPGVKPAKKQAGGSAAAPVVGNVKGLPKPVAKAIENRKVLVLLFWDRDSADDRSVRRSVKDVDRWDGDVVVHSASVKKVSRYGRITRGADVAQSPTTLVVDRNLKVTPLVGFVDTRTIDQAVLDALRNSGGFLKDPFLAKVNAQCVASGRNAFGVPEPSSVAQMPAYVQSHKRVMARFSARMAGVKAPKKWRAFKRATMRDTRASVAMLGEWAAFLGRNPSPTRVQSSVVRFAPRSVVIGKRFQRRMAGEHVLACTSDL
jgi:hypothetical protein